MLMWTYSRQMIDSIDDFMKTVVKAFTKHFSQLYMLLTVYVLMDWDFIADFIKDDECGEPKQTIKYLLNISSYVLTNYLNDIDLIK